MTKAEYGLYFVCFAIWCLVALDAFHTIRI
jgi:hypothetical protein